MPRTVRRSPVILGFSLAAMLVAPLASAQDWAPTKPITIIVNVPPGSSTDLVARILGEKLPARLGQPVVTENRPGASGFIGAGAVARAPADGHTLGVVPGTLFIAPHVLPKGAGGGLDVVRDLVPIVNTASSPLLILANPQAGVRTPRELVAWLRANPGTAYATSGNGSPMHIAGEMLARQERLQMTHVPYRGVTPAVADTVSGQVKIVFSALGGIGQFITAGKLVPIASIEKRRSALLPDLPTLGEVGIPNVEVSVFFPLLGPAGLPAPVVRRLNAEANAVLREADVRERLRAAGVEVIGGTAEDAAREIRQAYDHYGRVVRELAIRGD